MRGYRLSLSLNYEGLEAIINKVKGIFVDNVFMLATIVVEALLGVILLANHGLSTLMFIVLGIVLLLAALRSGIHYFAQEAEQAARGGNGALCLAETAAGVFLITRSAWLSNTILVVSVFLGICLIAAGLVKAQWAIDSLRLSRPRWPFPAVDAAVTLGCGALVLAAPFTQQALWIFAGIAFMVLAVADVIGQIMLLRTRNTPEQVDFVAEETAVATAAVTPTPLDETPLAKEATTAEEQESDPNVAR